MIGTIEYLLSGTYPLNLYIGNRMRPSRNIRTINLILILLVVLGLGVLYLLLEILI